MVRKAVGLTQRWRKYDQITMVFFKYDSLDGELRSSEAKFFSAEVRAVMKYFVLKGLIQKELDSTLKNSFFSFLTVQKVG